MNCPVAWTDTFLSQKLHWDGNSTDEDKLNLSYAYALWSLDLFCQAQVEINCLC